MRKITFWLLLLTVAFSTKLNAQTEGFETTNVGDIPTGWVGFESQPDDPGFQVMDQTGYAYQGSKYLAHLGNDIAAESTSWVVSSAFNVGTYYELKFHWRGRWTSAYNFTAVYISTASNDPVANPGDFTMLKELSPANYPNTWLQWNEEAFDLSAYANQNVYIAFKYIGDFAHDIFIDEVGVGPMPYCELPDNLEVVNRGMDFLDIQWDGVLGVDDYEVIWGAPGFDPNAAGNNPPVLVSGATSYQITGLSQSTSYEIYVRSVCSSYNYSTWNGPALGMTSGPPPANDDCDNAEMLTVYDFGGSIGNEITASTIDATDSNNHPSCDDTGTNLDVWYTFTVPAGSTSVFVLTGGANGAEIEAALYDACGGVEYACESNSSSKQFSGLTAGQTYILQVWHDEYNSGEFTIAIEKAPAAPTNDECVNAINMTVYPFNSGTGNELAQTTLSATDSGNHPSCDDFGTNLDLWYSVTVPAGETGFTIITGGAEGNSIEAAVYDTCNGNELACLPASGLKTVNGLTGGQTYIVQIWHDDFNAGVFNIVFESLAPPPANDSCANATSVTVTTTCSNPTYGYNLGASDSGVPDPGCANYSGGDIWFSITVPASGNVTIETTPGNTGSVTDTGMAVYDGDCTNLNLIECDDDDSAQGFFSMIELTGRTPGETIYVRVWEYGNNSFGEIGVCAYDSSVSLAENIIEGLKFYPNPVNNTLNIQAQNNIDLISIYNISGQEIVNIKPNVTKKQIDMSHLTNGMYFIKVQVNGKLTAFKVVKK